MKCRVLLLALLLAPLAADGASAYYCEGGQQPVPPAVAERMALPLCGIGATQPWGPNGCQLCDTRNMYPSPFTLSGKVRTHLSPQLR
jgi:hypothetical protein